MSVASEGGQDAPNHPHAVWMGLIAGLSHNLIVGCLMGSFSVMLASVEARLGVSRAESSSVGGLVLFGAALIGAFLGPVVARVSLRPLMFLGAAMMVAGFAILAFTASYPLYLATYLLLFGPSMAITGSMGPATLVTRWFGRNRGLALGLVHLPLVVAFVPLACTWLLENHGAEATYLTLAAVVGAVLLPATLLIRDHPPGAAPTADAGAPALGRDTMDVPQILRSGAFWAITVVAGLIIASLMMLTFNMIQIAATRGITGYAAASLQAIMAFAGMAGSILFGWVADRIGGARGMALIAFNSAVLLGLLLVDLPYAALVVVFALLGLNGAGMIPNVSRALAHSLGLGSFSRAIGLQGALSVPFTLAGIVAMGASFDTTQSYAPALAGIALLLLAAIPIAFYAAGRAFSRG
jgi:cyanate permease